MELHGETVKSKEIVAKSDKIVDDCKKKLKKISESESVFRIEEVKRHSVDWNRGSEG